MSNYQDVLQELLQLRGITLNVKQEIKTLKNRVRAYKGWTKRYRRQQQELKQINLVVTQQRDEAVLKLETKQRCLLKTIEEARQAKELRDKALLQLDEVIDKIEQYKAVCDRANKIVYADKAYLITEAENIFFDEPISDRSFKLDSREKPQMFTDKASIGRDLLDR